MKRELSDKSVEELETYLANLRYQYISRARSRIEQDEQLKGFRLEIERVKEHLDSREASPVPNGLSFKGGTGVIREKNERAPLSIDKGEGFVKFSFCGTTYHVPEGIDIVVEVWEEESDFNFLDEKGEVIPMLGGTDEKGNPVPSWKDVGIYKV